MNYNIPPPSLPPPQPFYNFDWMLSKFLAQRPKQLATTIDVTKQELLAVSTQLQSLRCEYDWLQSQIKTIPAEDWQTSIDHLERGRIEAANRLATTATELVRRRVARRQKRKRHAAATTQRFSRIRSEQRLKRAETNQRIDAWQSDRIEQLAVAKQKAADAERVTQILANVTKRMVEAQRQLDTLTALIELRRARRAQAVGRRSEDGASDRAFVESIDRLRAVWRDALANYEREADQLRQCVEPNAETKVEAWRRVLFGAGSRDLVKRSSADELWSIR